MEDRREEAESPGEQRGGGREVGTSAQEGKGARDACEAECRICRQPASEGRPLLMACSCKGSVAFQHEECLVQWLTLAPVRRTACEICLEPYRTRRCLKPLWQWTLPLLSTEEKRKFVVFTSSYALAALDLAYSIRYFILPLRRRPFRGPDVLKLLLLMLTSASWLYIFAQHQRFFRSVASRWFYCNTTMRIASTRRFQIKAVVA